MRKLILLSFVILFSLGCLLAGPIGPFEPTMQPPLKIPPLETVIVELPYRPTSAPAILRIKPMLGDDTSDASTFVLIIKTQLMAGDYLGIAERVEYPINIKLKGLVATINTAADFENNFKEIFTTKVQNALINADENNIHISTKGVGIGNGEIWFNQFCSTANCTDGVFLITQINN